jgi:hypothetical protein
MWPIRSFLTSLPPKVQFGLFNHLSGKKDITVYNRVSSEEGELGSQAAEDAGNFDFAGGVLPEGLDQPVVVRFPDQLSLSGF